MAEAIQAYHAHQRAAGNRARSIETSAHVLRRFFAPVLERPLATLTPARAAALYEDLRLKPGPRGTLLSVDSHRNYLAQARSLLGWTVEQRLLERNPLEEVKGQGRRRHGKAQPRIDEARKLYATALELARAGDPGALAVLMLMLMAPRASELVTRRKRDLDDSGRILWVDENPELEFQPKTAAGRRPLQVPVELQPLLIDLARAKLPGALLFPGRGGRPHWRDWPTEQVRRLCELAAVPVVCAHALRGFVASAALQAGAAPELVAQVLGHESSTTTLQSYAAPGSAAAQAHERGLGILRGRDDGT